MIRNPVYASTAGIAHLFPTLPDLLAGLTGHGLDRIELGWSPPLGGLELPGGLARFPAHWLVHNYFPAPAKPFVLNLASQNLETLAASRTFCLDAIRLCAAVDAPFYSVHCGFLAEFEAGSLGHKLTHGEIWDYEHGYATFVDSLRLLRAEAARAGIRLLIEPNVVAAANLVEGRNSLLMMAEPQEFARLLGDLPRGTVEVLLDLGHLKVTSTTLGFAIEDFVQAVAPVVGAFHLHDNDGMRDLHLPVTAGSWALAIIQRPEFAGRPVVNEAKFPGAREMIEHCIWLHRLLNH